MNLIQDYFLDSVARHSERPALEIAGQEYSYQALSDRVFSMVGWLQKQGIKNKAIIVLNDHTLDSYAGILAVNFSGNTILPLELSWPQQRIKDVIMAVRPGAMLYNEQHADALAALKEISDCLFIHTGSSKVTGSLKNCPDYAGVAYIIFTSGSTGVPKGVPVKQSSLNALLEYYKKEYDFNQNDRFLQVYEITFDVAYFSFLVPLSAGACCCVVNSKNGIPKYLSIVDDLLKRKISVVSMVPSILPFVKKYLRKEKMSTLRYSFFSGDALYHSDALAWKDFAPNAAIHNFYGPTETTIVCTRYIWNETETPGELVHDVVPLGKAFPDMHFKIVDEANVDVAEGAVGELSFAGVQVIDAYLNNVHANCFFTAKHEGAESRFYKTGDLASLNRRGNLVFHGRKDHQVKINGYRIELEEVQLALQKLVQRNCVVIKKRNEQNIDYLKAFIEGEPANAEELKLALKKYLPEYMIPAELEFIAQIPLSENDKINKRYLQSL